MEWDIKYKKDAYRFLARNYSVDRVEKTLSGFIKEKVRADIKKLYGKLSGHYRLRLGKIRVIFKVDFNLRTIYIKKADFRGNIYK